jgi:HEAT repeat protein
MRLALSTALLLSMAPLLTSAATQEADSPDPKLRIKAAKDAVKAGSPGIARLGPLLKDPDEAVRVEAVKSVVEIGSRFSLEPLIAALQDPSMEIQLRATDGLVNFYDPGYVRTGLSGTINRAGSALRARFTAESTDRVIDPWIEVRPEIVTGIARLVKYGAAAEVKANAARALGVLRGAGALEELHEALRSKDTRLIFESLVALQKIRDPRSGARVAFLFRDPEDHVAAAALETAGLVRSTEALPDIETALRRASSLRVRQAAISALALIGDMRSRDLLFGFLGDKDEITRAAAIEGVGRLKQMADRPALTKAFDEERKMRPRLAAAFGVTALGDASLSEMSALRYLVNTLNSKAWRNVAEAFLMELAREKPVRTALESVAADGTTPEKTGLSRILGASGDRETIPHLERLTRDAEPDVMQEAVRALRNLKARNP